MTTTITVIAGTGTGNKFSLNGSGLGFYGSSFGSAIRVNEYNQTTFITNSNGTVQGPRTNNVRYVSATTGLVNELTNLNLLQIPNQSGTLNIRIASDSPISTQNARLYGTDRVSSSNGPSGVTLRGAEIIHPWATYTPAGSGSSSWVNLNGISSYLSLSSSPGISGLVPGSSAIHDYYIALSASPSSIGSKTQFGFLFEVEYA